MSPETFLSKKTRIVNLIVARFTRKPLLENLPTINKLKDKITLPSFDFSKVKGDLSVGHRFLIQVAAIPPYER